MLGSLLFNIFLCDILNALFNNFLCDLFFFISDIGIASYVDDSTPYTYTVDKSPEKIIEVLEDTCVDFLIWFEVSSEMNVNADKCHLLVNSKDKACTKT